MKRLTSNRRFPAEVDRALAPKRFAAVHPETEALERNLDRIYDGLRRRARREWLRSHSDTDPSDACVSVRIHGGAEMALSALIC